MPSRKKKRLKPASVRRYSYDQKANDEAADSVQRIKEGRANVTAAHLQDLNPERLADTANLILGGQLECAWSKTKAVKQKIPPAHSPTNEREGGPGRPLSPDRDGQAKEI